MWEKWIWWMFPFAFQQGRQKPSKNPVYDTLYHLKAEDAFSEHDGSDTNKPDAPNGKREEAKPADPLPPLTGGGGEGECFFNDDEKWTIYKLYEPKWKWALLL